MSQLEATYRNEVISRLERLTGGPNASALDDAAGSDRRVAQRRRHHPRLRHRSLRGVRHGDRRACRWADPDEPDRPARRRAVRRPRRRRCSPGRRSSATRRSSTSCSTASRCTTPTCSSSPPTPGSTGRSSRWPLQVKQRGHKVIAVTSLEHTNAVTPKHPSGQRLCEIADVVIDNLAPVRRRHDDHRRAASASAPCRRSPPRSSPNCSRSWSPNDSSHSGADATGLHLGEHPRR